MQDKAELDTKKMAPPTETQTPSKYLQCLSHKMFGKGRALSLHTGAKLFTSINSDVISLTVDIRGGRDKWSKHSSSRREKHPSSAHLSGHSFPLARIDL